MTHKQLVKKAKAWLTKSHRVVLTELATSTSETPDAIGFKGTSEAGSTLIECKTSRADFHADKHKHFRREPERGMGDRRYFMAPKGVLSPDDLPEGWGLLEVTEHQVKEKAPAKFVKANKAAEIIMLISVIRRLELSTAVFVVAEKEEGGPQE